MGDLSCIVRTMRREKGLRIRVRPRAQKTRVLQIREDGTVEIAVAAPPEKGKANKTLLRFLARILGIDVKNLRILPSTQRHPQKVVILEGIDLQKAIEILKQQIHS